MYSFQTCDYLQIQYGCFLFETKFIILSLPMNKIVLTWSKGYSYGIFLNIGSYIGLCFRKSFFFFRRSGVPDNMKFSLFLTVFKFFNIIKKGEKRETYFISCIIGWTYLRKKLLSIHWKEFRKTVHENIRGKYFFSFLKIK